MGNYKVLPLEEGAERGWTVKLDGKEVSANHIEMANPELGTSVIYGQRPEGFDGPILKERGGGGSVTVPYMIHPTTGALYVGLIREYRPTMGGDGVHYAVPRGMLDMGESHLDASVRETKEELGLKSNTLEPILLAEGKNFNSAFFDTSEDGEGVKFFALPVSLEDLVEKCECVFTFSTDALEEKKLDKNEKIFGSKFFPIQDVLHSRDMISAAAAGYLLLFLMGNLSR
jgi:ADP-ribose pyrophosphatase YjhB (NUDIX family)